MGLKIGNYEYVPSEYKNLVQDVKYENRIAAPGTRITEGASVTLLVGKGLSNETTIVVSLRELTLEQAIEKAHSSSLNIGATLYDTPPQNEKEKELYVVYRQDPVTGSKVLLGQSINIFLTKDKTLLDEPEATADDELAEEEGLWD